MKSRSVFRLILPALVAGAFAGGCSAPHQVGTVNLEQAKEHLQAVSGARILLGHQSVGRNILAGVQSLADETGVALRIEEIDGLPPDAGPGLFHANIGRNGDPDSKCQVFEHLLTRPERPAYDLAMMKFCYDDLGRDTPMAASAMLERYSRLVAKLAEQRPDVRLMHISLPLRADWTGWKVKLNRLLGRDIPVDADNALRNLFNEGLRERYADEPFFELARLESTHADGSRSSFSLDGRTIYTLAPEYTHDGGHLNDQAQRLIAAEFLRALAAALPEPAEEQLSDAGA